MIMANSKGQKSDLEDVDVDLIHETDAAYLFQGPVGGEVWIPKSMCEYDKTSGTIAISQSYAEKKGLV